MIFTLTKASEHMDKPSEKAIQKDGKWCIELKTLEDLMSLIKEVRNDLIVSEDEIIIYDDYME